MSDNISTRRLRRALKVRETAFLPVGPSAGAMLAELEPGVEVVYLVGVSPASWLTWALTGLPDGWTPGSHYLEATAPVLRYRGPDGRKVEMHRAAQWFGPGDYSAYDADTAWAFLKVAVSTEFRDATLLATPATTARELFLRTIPYGREWPVLSGDLQDLIRSTSGQGRTEVVHSPDDHEHWLAKGRYGALSELPALFEYDGRLMYAALCWGLPMGVPSWDAVDDYAGQTRGRYRVRVTVPRDWMETFGLVGVKRDDGSRLWEYPAERGRTFSTWCDGAELQIVLRAGWDVRILERLLWADGPGRGPLDTWSQKLVTVRNGLEANGRNHPDYADISRLAAYGVRALLLHGIGSFHGRPHTVTQYRRTDDPGTIPAGATNVRLEGDWIVYTVATADTLDTATPDTSWRARLSHPEWSAAIWARARARLVSGPQSTGALNRTAGEVVGFRTDAIYFTARQDWPDDNRPGRMRLKRALTEGPYPWPASGRELVELRERGQVIA